MLLTASGIPLLPEPLYGLKQGFFHGPEVDPEFFSCLCIVKIKISAGIAYLRRSRHGWFETDIVGPPLEQGSADRHEGNRYFSKHSSFKTSLPVNEFHEIVHGDVMITQDIEVSGLSLLRSEYMPDVKPTAMVSVPRLYEKIYGAVYDRLEKAPENKKRIFNWAITVGKEFEYKKKDNKPLGPVLKLKHAIADKLVLSNIRTAVGGPKNFFSAGGAPLSQDIEEFFFAAGLLICQGYGLTETSPMITCNSPGAFKFGTVGRPIKGCEVKIGEDGEILARGGNIMKGYYNKTGDKTPLVYRT